MQSTLRAITVAGVLGLSSSSAFAQDPGGSGAPPVTVIFVTVADDGTTIVDCTGIDCTTEDCSGNENEVVSGVPIRMRRLEDNSCASEALTLDEAQEFDDALLELDDLLLTGDDPADDKPTGGRPIKVDTPYLKEDEDNQQIVGKPPSASPNSVGD